MELILAGQSVKIKCRIKASILMGNYEFYYAGNGRMESYADWSEEQSKKISYAELLGWIKEAFPGKEEFFLIQTKESCMEGGGTLEGSEELYQSGNETVRDEEYRIFKVRL